MDIGAFSENGFDPVAWINATYHNSEQKDNKEAFVVSLVSKLQLYVQQVSSSLEDSSQQILSGFPRVVKDAQNLQNEVLHLKEKMSEVQSEIRQVQNETGACMSNLERLDALKTKLQVAKQGLQESDGWGKLVTELEDHFERNDMVSICEKLTSLQKSLTAQQGLAGQNDRENQVEGFKNRLEALASPSVVKYFSVGDVEQSKKFVEIFASMDRSIQLTQYYRTVQKTMLQQQWSEIIDLSENTNRFLHDFYEFLYENFKKQTKWCIQVFGENASDEAILVLVELFPILQPSREAAILGALKRSNEKLEVLQEFSTSNVYFWHLLSKSINLQSENAKTKSNVKALAKSIFDYFNTFINQYAVIEQNYLATNLANFNLIQNSVNETIRNMRNGNKKVMEWMEQALVRCEKITQYCAIAPLVIVLNSIVKTFIEKYKKAQQQLTASRNIEQDWSLLQSCMSLLQNIGEFYNSLIEFERVLSEKVLEMNEKFLESLNDDKLQFGYRIIEKRDLNEFKKLVNIVKDSFADPAVDSATGIFSSVLELIMPICAETHDTTLAAVFAPIEKHLEHLNPREEIINASGSDLPDYSFAPQEFITQIGQYLLTLPQHLEPLLLSPTISLRIALELSDRKYTENIPCADILLSLVVDECCALYQKQILRIQSLSSTAAKQIATDIEYFGSVLEELGLTLVGQLQKTALLLRATPDNYLSVSSGCEPKLVAAVRQMRNIISSD